jgi:hypothetical protein
MKTNKKRFISLVRGAGAVKGFVQFNGSAGRYISLRKADVIKHVKENMYEDENGEIEVNFHQTSSGLFIN